ncbi:hypothetical protein [Glaciecola petra]|uniref:Uncharacterized protein n=1 Tax=Glaciecola petra TaxID=3075602 RepID=A0ABU2ZVJ0_9ALTE|nr:hypothetical protein [Aestuariibacter sp. P117]MDT0596670.1 hypothetical protein [Aestuariibacter sp. P117]
MISDAQQLIGKKQHFFSFIFRIAEKQALNAYLELSEQHDNIGLETYCSIFKQATTIG